MSRGKQYQRLLNSKRWKVVRANYLREHPLCERCLREGISTAAIDVHHRVPVESAKTISDMERLCYNVDGGNLEALCIPCHRKAHMEMRSQTREKHQQAEADRLQRWIERIKQYGKQ